MYISYTLFVEDVELNSPPLRKILHDCKYHAIAYQVVQGCSYQQGVRPYLDLAFWSKRLVFDDSGL